MRASFRPRRFYHAIYNQKWLPLYDSVVIIWICAYIQHSITHTHVHVCVGECAFIFWVKFYFFSSTISMQCARPVMWPLMGNHWRVGFSRRYSKEGILSWYMTKYNLLLHDMSDLRIMTAFLTFDSFSFRDWRVGIFLHFILILFLKSKSLIGILRTFQWLSLFGSNWYYWAHLFNVQNKLNLLQLTIEFITEAILNTIIETSRHNKRI